MKKEKECSKMKGGGGVGIANLKFREGSVDLVPLWRVHIQRGSNTASHNRIYLSIDEMLYSEERRKKKEEDIQEAREREKKKGVGTNRCSALPRSFHSCRSILTLFFPSSSFYSYHHLFFFFFFFLSLFPHTHSSFYFFYFLSLTKVTYNS